MHGGETLSSLLKAANAHEASVAAKGMRLNSYVKPNIHFWGLVSLGKKKKDFRFIPCLCFKRS